MAATLNFVNVDAITADDHRVALTFTPAFSPEVRRGSSISTRGKKEKRGCVFTRSVSARRPGDCVHSEGPGDGREDFHRRYLFQRCSGTWLIVC